MAQVALNLVAFVASCALALWTLMALQFVVYDAITRLAWQRRELFLDMSLAGAVWRGILSLLLWLSLPAIVVSLVLNFAPEALPWAVERWGFWSGVAVAAVLVLLVVLGTTREERMAGFYGEHRAVLKARLVIRQQSYLKPFREAWEASEKARQAVEKNRAAPAATAADEQASLDFEILDVDLGQQIVDAPPYAKDGGDWTVCTCRLLSGGRAAFYFAERGAPSADGAPFAWGEARMWVPSVADGADLAEAIGDAFRVTQGRSRASGSMPAAPLSFGTAVLSRATAPRPDGSFAGTGSWTASKWFYEDAAELYVSWSLDEKRGRIAEKDEGHAPELYAAFRRLVV
jgi:hypothetical protein